MSRLVPVSPARKSSVIVQNYCQRHRKWRLSGVVDCREGVSTLVWASAAPDIENFCVLSPSMVR